MQEDTEPDLHSMIQAYYWLPISIQGQVGDGLTSVEWEEEHRPDCERDAHDDDDLRKPGLVLVLRMHVVHQEVEGREHRQSGHHNRHDD